MISFKGKIHLNTCTPKQIKQLLNSAIRKECLLYVVNEENNKMQKLSIGQISAIKRCDPNRVNICLRKPSHKNGCLVDMGHHQQIGILDLLLNSQILEATKIEQVGCLSPMEKLSRDKMIYAMARDKYGYDPDKRYNSATGCKANSIRASIQKYKSDLDEETIRKCLKEAAGSFEES